MRPVDQIGANQFIEGKINDFERELEDVAKADVLAFFGPLVLHVDDYIRRVIEERKSDSSRSKLLVVLETEGGYVEIVQRIAETFRRHYRKVEFIIPNHAMSAGTVLVMSGDAIHMDYYAVLGPIDPQLWVKNRLVPALGYLTQYQRLLEKANDPQRGLSTAEMTLLVEGFDQADLYRFDQARNLSITLLKEWLVKYKFRNWKKTRTRGVKVTNKIRIERAEKIATMLSDPDRWHTHGRGISMDVLRKDVNLIIDDFDENPKLAKAVKEYYGLLVDYMTKLGHSAVLHMAGVYMPMFV